MFVSTHDFWRRLFSAAFILLMFSARSIASDIQSFDLDAGDAGQVLKQFAKQSGLSIVYDPQSVKGVQTQEVVGMLLPKDALERMLHGTALVFKEDLETGAFAVTRSEVLIANLTTQSTEPKPLIIEETEMNAKKNNWLKTLAAVLTFGIAAELGAQEAESGEIFELNPFTIDASEDVGYSSSNTLAGTRLRTDMKDLGSSIVIVNEQFMEDIGATNASELLSYVAGVEVGGSNGNFSGANFGSGFARSNEMRRRPQDATRVRGLASAGLTRDLFLTDIPFDSYNTERVEIQRGPNAILFGLGSPGGIINNGLIKPHFGGDSFEARARFDDVSTQRFTIDYNKEIIADTLAVRVASLHQDERFEQDLAFLRDDRTFAAGTWTPRIFKGDSFSKTEFILNGERGNVRGTPPDYIGPIDSLTPWFTNAYDTPVKPLWDAKLEGTFPEFRLDRDQGLRNPGMFQEPVFIFETPDGIEPTGVGGDNVSFQPFFSPSTTNEYIGPGGRFRGSLDIGGFPRLQALGFGRQGVTDFNQIDFRNILIGGRLDEVTRDFSTASFAVSQRFLNGNAGVEYVFDRQKYEDSFQNPIDSSDVRGSGVRLDLTTVMPDGRVNPNVGRPFIVLDNPDINNGRIVREAHRVTSYLKFDAEEQLDLSEFVEKMIGQHTLTGFFNRQTIDTLNINEELNVVPRDNSDIFESAFRTGSRLTRSLEALVYVGPHMLNASSPSELQFTPPSVDFFRDDRTMLVRAVDQDASLADGVTETVTRDISVRTKFISSGNIQKQEIDSDAAILQSYWLDRQIVTMFGWRHDSTTTYFQNGAPENADREDILSLLRLPFQPTGEGSGDSFSSSVVLHSPRGWQLPLQSQFSLHYSQSENFQPVAQRVNALGENIGSPSGETEDIGFSVSMFENKLNLRVNFYDAVAANATSTEGSATLRKVFGVQGIPIDYITKDVDGGLAPESLLQKFIDTLPAKTKEVTDAQFLIGTDGTTRVGYQIRVPGNMVATENTASEGVEIDLTYSPTSNWRIALNASQQKASLSNLASALRELYGPFLLILPEVANLPISPGDPETIGFVNATGGILPYNSLIARDNTVVSELREWRVNAISNYQFTEGILDGFGIGGAIRWQDGVAIGFPLNDVDGALIPDRSNPYFGEAETSADVWINYQREVFGNMTWDIQLNVRNIAGGDLVPIRAQPDGTSAQVRYATPRKIILSTGISF